MLTWRSWTAGTLSYKGEKTMTQHEQNDPIAAFNAYERAMNAGDIDVVMALFDDNVTTHNCGLWRGL